MMHKLAVSIFVVVLRIVIYISDVLITDDNPVAQERFYRMLPQGVWDAYWAYCDIDLAPPKTFSLAEEAKAESMAGCNEKRYT